MGAMGSSPTNSTTLEPLQIKGSSFYILRMCWTVIFLPTEAMLKR